MIKYEIMPEAPLEKGRWIVLGCGKDGYWIANKYPYRFKDATEQSMMLKWALQDTAEIRLTVIPITYTVAEV